LFPTGFRGNETAIIVDQGNGDGPAILPGEGHRPGGQEEGLRPGFARLDDPPRGVDLEMLGACGTDTRNGGESSGELGVRMSSTCRSIAGEVRRSREHGVFVLADGCDVALE